jgi:hypothetical protein
MEIKGHVKLFVDPQLAFPPHDSDGIRSYFQTNYPGAAFRVQHLDKVIHDSFRMIAERRPDNLLRPVRDIEDTQLLARHFDVSAMLVSDSPVSR